MIKRLFFILLTVLVSALIAQSQTGRNTTLTKQKASPTQEPTFFDIQKQFNEKWADKNVINGYYEEDGVKKKAPGWKQFKRWEWYWADRVDPTTGEFPKKSAADVFATRKANGGNSKNAAGNWTNLGPNSSDGGYSGIGRLNCVAFRPGDNNTFYVGSPSGGLWKTVDGGSNWTVLTDQNEVLGVSDAIVIAGATTATDIIYIGTGDRDGGSSWTLGSGRSRDNNGIGVLKSTNGGASWNTTGLTFAASAGVVITRLLMDPNNNSILYAASNNGLYKSTNAGATWVQKNGGGFIDLEFNPANSAILYGSSVFGDILRSVDSGETWSFVFQNYSSGGRRIELAVSPEDASLVYAVQAASDRSLFAILKSTNSGQSFSSVYNSLNLLGWDCDGGDLGVGQGSYDLAIAVDPTNADNIFVGGVNTWKSTDGGANWSIANIWTNVNYPPPACTADEVHADKHCLAFQNGTSTIFECNDGGIYKSNDNGVNWQDLSNGIVISQMYRLGVSQTDNKVMAGLQDNGTKANPSGTWLDVIGGDGMDCMIDYTNSGIQYGEGANGSLRRTTNSWSSSWSITTGLTGTSYWVMPIAIDPTNSATIYAARQDVFRSTNQGTSWTKISNWNSTQLKELAIAPSNSNYIYTTTQSKLYRTTNGGTSWSEITGSLPVGSSSITYISVKDDDPNTVWVSMGQYNADGVYETPNGGTTWTNISTGLPQVPVMCVIQNKQNTTQTELYAATDAGVYLKLGTGGWTLFDTGLPNVVVTELKIAYNTTVPESSILYAATFGRGMWKSEVYSPDNVAPNAEFVADITTPGIGQTVTFTDLSANIPTSWTWTFNPATVTYVGGTSATSQNPQVQFNAAGNYSVQLTATNAHGSDSEVKNNYISVAELLSYCTAEGSTTDEWISGVQLGTINNTGTSGDHYHDYTYLSTDLETSQSYNITVTNGLAYTGDDLGVWIDWNQDGDFDDVGENIVCEIDEDGQGTFNFTVPATATAGSTTMRIRIKYYGSDCGDPCGSTTYGEVEDYRINVYGTSVWLGITTIWNEIQNWSDGKIPGRYHNVTIPTSPVGGHFPVVPSSVNATCYTLTLENGSNIEIDGNMEVIK